MNKLPKEVLIAIIGYLGLPEKFTCLGVSKRLYDTITIDLYKDLTFYDLDQIEKAVAMFKDRGKLGHRTSNLKIDSIYLDKKLVLLLPSLFPKIKSLTWSEGDIGRKQQKSVLGDMDAQQLCNWKHLEKLVDRPHRLHISTKLLGLCTFNSLKILQVSFVECPMFENDQPNRRYITQLLSNIKNAPNLQQLKISETALDLEDMELLHSSLPQLQELSLDVVYVLAEKLVNVITIANRLQSFSLSFAKLGNLSIVEITDILIDWIRYMSAKYTQVQHIKFGHDLLDTSSYESDNFDAPTYEYDLLEQPLIETLYRLPNIKSYAIQATAMTSKIMDAINSNCHQLTNLQLYLDNNTQMKHEFGLLPAYRQVVERIESLTITRISCGKIDGLLLGQSLCDLANASLFSNLVSLKLENIFNNGQIVLLNILKTFHLLETLHVNQIGFRFPHVHILTDVIHTSGIKELNLRICSERKDYDLVYISDYFAFVLQSCPLLERFSLSGQLAGYDSLLWHPNNELYLSFLNHTQIKNIRIKLHQCQYFTFTNERKKDEDQRWYDYFEPLEEEQENNSYHIHLAWRGQLVPDLVNVYY